MTIPKFLAPDVDNYCIGLQLVMIINKMGKEGSIEGEGEKRGGGGVEMGEWEGGMEKGVGGGRRRGGGGHCWLLCLLSDLLMLTLHVTCV